MFVMQSWIYFAAIFTNLLFSALAFGMFLCSCEKNKYLASYQWKLINDRVVKKKNSFLFRHVVSFITVNAT